MNIEGKLGLRNLLSLGPVVVGLSIGGVYGVLALWEWLTSDTWWDDHMFIALGTVGVALVVGISFRLGFAVFRPRPGGKLPRWLAIVLLAIWLFVLGLAAALAWEISSIGSL